MKLTQLYYFQTICKYQNITRAATELHISQPSLSNAIKELENEFGVPLFFRLSKGLALTDEGRVLLAETDKLLQQAEHLASSMNALKTAGQTIRLGVPPMLAALIFPQLLQAFHAAYPDVSLQMVENGSLTNRNLVLDGVLDAPSPPLAAVTCAGWKSASMWQPAIPWPKRLPYARKIPTAYRWHYWQRIPFLPVI